MLRGLVRQLQDETVAMLAETMQPPNTHMGDVDIGGGEERVGVVEDEARSLEGEDLAVVSLGPSHEGVGEAQEEALGREEGPEDAKAARDEELEAQEEDGEDMLAFD